MGLDESTVRMHHEEGGITCLNCINQKCYAKVSRAQLSCLLGVKLQLHIKLAQAVGQHAMPHAQHQTCTTSLFINLQQKKLRERLLIPNFSSNHF